MPPSSVMNSRRFSSGRDADFIARPPHRTVRAAFPHTACMGLSLSRVHHAIFVVLCCFILCSTRAASILSSRPHITVAVAHSDSQRRLYGAFFVKGASRHFCRALLLHSLFDPRREHSFVPTTYYRRRRAQ